MANSNGKITAPVSIYDIQSVVPVVLRRTNTSTGQVETISSCDLGTICGAKVGDTIPADDGNGSWTVISRTEINMWAKYKPVIRSGRIDTTNIVGTTTSALKSDKTWKPTTDYTTQYSWWWAADDTNHGLVVPFVNITWSPQGFLDALNTIAGWIDGKLNHWTYNMPTGENAAPYRDIDFNGYNHKAPQPIKATSGSPQVVAAIRQVWTYGMSMMIPMPTAYDDRDYIIPTDLKIDNTIWQTLYEGIAIYRKVGNTYDAVAWVNGDQWNGYGIIYSDQSDAPVISGGSAVQARFKDGGTYYAIPVYFTKGDLAQPNDGYSFIGNNGSNIKVIPVPYVNFLSFTAVQRSSSQAIGMPVISNREVTRLGYLTTNVSLDATRDGYNGGTALTVRVSVVNQDWNGTPASGNNAYDNTFNNVTVANNTIQLVVALEKIAIDYLTKSGWRIIVSVNGEETTIGLITPAVQTPVQSNQ